MAYTPDSNNDIILTCGYTPSAENNIQIPDVDLCAPSEDVFECFYTAPVGEVNLTLPEGDCLENVMAFESCPYFAPIGLVNITIPDDRCDDSVDLVFDCQYVAPIGEVNIRIPEDYCETLDDLFLDPVNIGTDNEADLFVSAALPVELGDSESNIGTDSVADLARIHLFDGESNTGTDNEAQLARVQLLDGESNTGTDSEAYLATTQYLGESNSNVGTDSTAYLSTTQYLGESESNAGTDSDDSNFALIRHFDVESIIGTDNADSNLAAFYQFDAETSAGQIFRITPNIFYLPSDCEYYYTYGSNGYSLSEDGACFTLESKESGSNNEGINIAYEPMLILGNVVSVFFKISQPDTLQNHGFGIWIFPSYSFDDIIWQTGVSHWQSPRFTVTNGDCNPQSFYVAFDSANNIVGQWFEDATTQRGISLNQIDSAYTTGDFDGTNELELRITSYPNQCDVELYSNGTLRRHHTTTNYPFLWDTPRNDATSGLAIQNTVLFHYHNDEDNKPTTICDVRFESYPYNGFYLPLFEYLGESETNVGTNNEADLVVPVDLGDSESNVGTDSETDLARIRLFDAESNVGTDNVDANLATTINLEDSNANIGTDSESVLTITVNLGEIISNVGTDSQIYLATTQYIGESNSNVGTDSEIYLTANVNLEDSETNAVTDSIADVALFFNFIPRRVFIGTDNEADLETFPNINAFADAETNIGTNNEANLARNYLFDSECITGTNNECYLTVTVNLEECEVVYGTNNECYLTVTVNLEECETKIGSDSDDSNLAVTVQLEEVECIAATTNSLSFLHIPLTVYFYPKELFVGLRSYTVFDDLFPVIDLRLEDCCDCPDNYREKTAFGTYLLDLAAAPYYWQDYIYGCAVKYTICANLALTPHFILDDISAATDNTCTFTADVDLGEANCRIGTGFVGDLFGFLYINLCRGHFIPDGLFISIELNDFLSYECFDYFSFAGTSNTAYLQITKHFDDVRTPAGTRYSTASLEVEGPWIVNSRPGTWNYADVRVDRFIEAETITGTDNETVFYEAPINCYPGTYSYATIELVPLDRLRFLEAGCLFNEYQYQDEDGYTLDELFQPIPIEGDPYRHIIKVECYI